jgi:hypothetical protein
MDLNDLIMLRVAVQTKAERNAYVDHQNAAVLLLDILSQFRAD